MIHQDLEGNFIDSDNNIVFFSYKYFLEHIIEHKACFICGATRGSKEFNDEHVIPNWIIKKYNLKDESITLLNGQKIKYTRYKIPCCVQCNGKLSAYYENPISSFFNKSYVERIKILHSDKEFEQKLFQWLALIFCKTHIFDTQMNFIPNRTIESPTISSLYDWRNFHIVHSIARNMSTNLIINEKYSTCLIFESAVNHERYFNYDYLDNNMTMSVLLRVGDMTIIASFLDFCIGHNDIDDSILGRLRKPLDMFQSIEIYSRIIYSLCSKSIKKRFTLSKDNNVYLLKGDILSIREQDGVKFEDIFLYYLEPRLDSLENPEEYKRKIKNEKYSFL